MELNSSIHQASGGNSKITEWLSQGTHLAELLKTKQIKGVNELEEFLSRSADPCEIDTPYYRYGSTPLMIACHGAEEDLVNFLLEKGADTEKVCSSTDNTALHYACLQPPYQGDDGCWTVDIFTSTEELQKRVRIVRSLLKRGATVKKNIEDMTPLQLAAFYGLEDVVDCFVSLSSEVGLSLEDQGQAFQLLGVHQILYGADIVDHIAKARGFFKKATELSPEDSCGDDPAGATDLFRCFCNGEYLQLGEGLEEDRMIWIKGYALGASILPDKFKVEHFWYLLVQLGTEALYHDGWGLETGLKLLQYLIQLEVKGQIELGSVLEDMSHFFIQNIKKTPKPVVMRYTCLLLDSYADSLKAVEYGVLWKPIRYISDNLGRMLLHLAYYHTQVQHLETLVTASERLITTINGIFEAAIPAGYHRKRYRYSVSAEFVMSLDAVWSRKGKLGRNRRTKDNVLYMLARLLRCDNASSWVLPEIALQSFLEHSMLATEDMDYFYALTQLMVRYVFSLDSYGCLDLTPKEAFMKNVQYLTFFQPDAPSFKKLQDLLSPRCNMLPLEEQAARVIMRNRIPYREKLPSGLADMFEKQYMYLGVKLTDAEADEGELDYSTSSESDSASSEQDGSDEDNIDSDRDSDDGTL